MGAQAVEFRVSPGDESGMARLIASIVFLGLIGLDLAWALARPGWLMIPAALAGWYVADLLSGAVHLLLDYLPCPPGVGLGRLFHYPGSRSSAEYAALKAQALARLGPFERLVFDFKIHHPRPDALGKRGFWHLAGSPALIVALPLALALGAANLIWPVPGWASLFGVVTIGGGALAQYFHATLHRDDEPPWPIPLGRRLGLLMTPWAHEMHHATLAEDFATTSGWSNPLINAVFRALERRGWISPDGLEPV